MKPIKIEVWRNNLPLSGFAYQSREVVADWRWRARSANNLIMASGQGYDRKSKLLATVRRLFPDAEAFPIVEVER